MASVGWILLPNIRHNARRAALVTGAVFFLLSKYFSWDFHLVLSEVHKPPLLVGGLELPLCSQNVKWPLK